MITPPAAGPRMAVEFHITWFRAMADGSSWRDTSRGVMAAWVGEAMPDRPAVRPAPRYTTASGGWENSEFTRSRVEHAAKPNCIPSHSFRRSTASTIPPAEAVAGDAVRLRRVL